MLAAFLSYAGPCTHHAKTSFAGKISRSANRSPNDWKRARQLRFGESPGQNRRARMCAGIDRGGETMEIGAVFDELKSDSDYVVVDGKDVESLIKEMQLSGEDALLAFEDEQERFLQLAEEKSDARDGGVHASPTVKKEVAAPEKVMEYFTDDNMMHMPKWAREAYQNGGHTELEKGSWTVLPEKSRGCLHAMVEAGNIAAPRNGLSGTGDAGVYGCSAADVAVDYSIPVELVVDILIELGAKTPILSDTIIQEKLMNKEIKSLLHIITSFDAQDLSDRYSDRSIRELADDYDLDVGLIEQLCEDEGIYLAVEYDTRLQLSREDRVLDILLNDGARGKPYPSLLEGLISQS